MTATPNEGYHFVNWTVNGSQVSTSETLSFTVTQDSTFVAHFEINSYEIEAIADPEEGGTISGAGTYNHFDECSLTATPNEGYHFVNWTVNGSQVSTSETLSFTVTQDSTFVAHFEINSYEIEAIADPEEGGTISGAGTYNHFDECSLTATPNEGYHFVNWTVNGSEVATEETISFIVTQDSTFVAHFELDSHEITASASPASYGTVSGAGTYNHFDECTLVATPNEGHVFMRWTKDGVTASIHPSFSFTVTEDADYVAQFRIEGYYINATANPEEGGTIDGAGGYSYGVTATLTAMPNPGYAFLNWTHDGEVVSTDASFDITVTGDAEYVANFEMLPRYNITVVQTEGGTLDAPASAFEGEFVTVTAINETQYRLVSLYYYTDDPEDATDIDLQTLQFSMPAANVTLSGLFQHFALGDVNLDGDVNIIDVLATLRRILGYNQQPFDFDLADMNGDGILDISDALAINAVILDFGGRADCDELYATYAAIDGTLYIDADIALAGYQFVLDAEPASLELQGFSTMGNWVDGKYVLLAFNLEGEQAPGLYPVLTLGNTGITDVTMATKEGCRVRGEEGTVGVASIDADHYSVYPVPAHNEVTVAGPDIASIEVFNTMGQRMVFIGNVSTDATTVNVSAWASGCYLFRIHTDQGTVLKKLTVVK